jgi:uncharacterized protein
MLVEAEVWTVAHTEQGNVVLIKPLGSETAVPIFIGQIEAQAILIGLGSVPMPRPLTHDLLLSILDESKIALERIEIMDFKNDTFFAQVQLKHGIKKMVIDARPSDAVALAVRKKCPIFISEDVVNNTGIPLSSFSVGNQDLAKIKKDKLEKDLKYAVDTENYEEAAKLRDQLEQFDKHSDS